MKRYEYRVVTIRTMSIGVLEGALNGYGEQGWRVRAVENGVDFLLEREIVEEPEEEPEPEMKMVKVTDLYVECALQVRNFGNSGLAMSDCCREPATSAVVMENGGQMWRCDEHRGIVGRQPNGRAVIGPVTYEVPRRKEW